ncbi:MAG: hypothetical protein ABGX69_01570 [Methylococcales bacterium]
MPLFIIVNLSLSILAQSQHDFQVFFKLAESAYIGLFFIAVAGLASVIKKIPVGFKFDLFATGTVLIWFYRWHNYYRDDAPMFYLFPFFFVILTAISSLVFVNRRYRFDQETIQALNYYSDHLKFYNIFIFAAVIASLFLTNHFIAYPVTIVLLMLRFVLSSCLEPYKHR